MRINVSEIIYLTHSYYMDVTRDDMVEKIKENMETFEGYLEDKTVEEFVDENLSNTDGEIAELLAECFNVLSDHDGVEDIYGDPVEIYYSVEA